VPAKSGIDKFTWAVLGCGPRQQGGLGMIVVYYKNIRSSKQHARSAACCDLCGFVGDCVSGGEEEDRDNAWKRSKDLGWRRYRSTDGRMTQDICAGCLKNLERGAVQWSPCGPGVDQ
jgi:hypothetical protein